FEVAANGDVNEWKVFLCPRQIKFHFGQFSDALRTHVADNSNDLHGSAEAGYKQRLADGIFVGKNFLRSRLADQTNVPASGDIVFVKITPGNERNSPGLQISRRDIVTRRSGPAFGWGHLAICAGVKGAIPTVKRNIAANCSVFDTWRVTQRGNCSLDKTLTRGLVWVLRDWQID